MELHCYDEDGHDLLEEPSVILEGASYFQDKFLVRIGMIGEEFNYTPTIDLLTDGHSTVFLNFPDIPETLSMVEIPDIIAS